MTNLTRKQEDEKAAIQSIKSLYIFLRNFWSVNTEDPFIDNWHIRKICDELQEYGLAIAERRAIADCIINIPPGSSKSTMVSQMFPVWLWLHAPWAVVISSSYSHTLSVEHSIKSKAIFKSDKFRYYFQEYFKLRFGQEINLTKDTEAQWQNNFGGRRYCTSTGGSVTGVHGHVIIRDDPISPEGAESKAVIEKANRFNDKTLSTRKKDKNITPTITVMQRLHYSDTTGHEIKKMKEEGLQVHHICLPATKTENVKPESWAEYYQDNLLDPIRMTKETLAKEKIRLGSYGYAGQYNQNPVPEGGGKVKEAWFVTCKPGEVPGGITWNVWLDGAYTDSTANDPTGLMVAGYHRPTKIVYVKHATSMHMVLPDLLDFLPEYCKMHGITKKSRIYYEPKASGHSIGQMMNRKTNFASVSIRGKLVRDGKEARLAVASPYIEAAKIIWVEGPYLEEVKAQLCGFPVHDHDEYVDLTGYLSYKHFRQQTAAARRRN
jgi:phage terminase large subunit-like protein